MADGAWPVVVSTPPPGRRTARPRWSRLAVVALVAVGPLAAAWGPASVVGVRAAGADPSPVVVTYAPAEFIDNVQSPSAVDADLADLAQFGVNRVLQNLTRLGRKGTLKLSATTSSMLPLWVSRAAAFDAVTGSSLSVTAVLDARVTRGFDVDSASTRSAVVADALRVAALGVAGIQLDFEPYPTTSGFVTLLGQLHVALAAAYPGVQLSVVAPTDAGTWTPAYLGAVSGEVDEVDPTFYDSGFTTAAAYVQWVTAGIATYDAETASTARIVPILPSYQHDPWHLPAVENITTATQALSQALAAGGRVDGAGIWWWWGFFYGSGGHYKPAADQTEWQSVTRPLLGI